MASPTPRVRLLLRQVNLADQRNIREALEARDFPVMTADVVSPPTEPPEPEEALPAVRGDLDAP